MNEMGVIQAPPGFMAVYHGKGRYTVYSMDGKRVDESCTGFWTEDGGHIIHWILPEGNQRSDPSKILRDLTTHDSW